MNVRPHQRLEVWSRAVEFVVEVYKATARFPPKEKYGLTSQIRRAAVSIPANIAEGAARQSAREFFRFISIAQGSATELETELLSAHRLGYLDMEEFERAYNELNTIARMLVGLSQHLKHKMENCDS